MGSRVQVTDTKTSSTLKFLPHTHHILVFIMNSVTTIVFLCYLISSPTVLSFTIPDQIKSLLGQDVNRQGSLEDNFRQQFCHSPFQIRLRAFLVKMSTDKAPLKTTFAKDCSTLKTASTER